ncbi:MAG: ribosome maturation factor RimM [Saprospiraceae bacterium]|nr:ribosome maturation factor RimM [Saprospiraceae bacterium]
MNKDKLFYLGKITKIFGYKGEVIFYFDVDDIGSYSKLDSVFIELKGKIIPFFLEKITFRKNNTAIVKIQDINDEESAINMVNSELFLPLEFLPKLTGNKFYFHEVIGFSVIDESFGNIGIIDKIYDYPHQDVFSIKKDYKEILIPVSDDIIKKVDRVKRQIEIEAPEGLIEIYLG